MVEVDHGNGEAFLPGAGPRAAARQRNLESVAIEQARQAVGEGPDAELRDALGTYHGERPTDREDPEPGQVGGRVRLRRDRFGASALKDPALEKADPEAGPDEAEGSTQERGPGSPDRELPLATRKSRRKAVMWLPGAPESATVKKISIPVARPAKRVTVTTRTWSQRWVRSPMR